MSATTAGQTYDTGETHAAGVTEVNDTVLEVRLGL